jgi:hypothetical protein
MRKTIFSAVLLMSGLQTLSNAVEVKTVVDGQLMGGQNYFDGSESSFGGVASLLVSPYMKFDERWSLVPLYKGDYRGTKQVTDLVGGGTLFQDSQNHLFSFKGIRSLPKGWKVKLASGYGFELLRETKDEDWGKGLYDNRRVFVGTEGEWSWAQNRYVRMAYDHYRLTFPNYQSLESGQVNNGLGRELSQPDVLNNHNHAFTLGTRLGLPSNGYADLAASYTLRTYPDQHIVDGSGALVSETRDDSIQTLSAEATLPLSKRLYSSLGYAWSHLYSDQNNYDAGPLVFTPNYYASITHSLASRWTLLMGDTQDPWTLNLNGSIARQSYSDRRVQDATGIYGADTTRVDSAYIGLGASYPIAKGFRLAASAYWGWQDSNNTYNAVYQYHYNTQTYLMGFTYEY